jgi:hypothetical protein
MYAVFFSVLTVQLSPSDNEVSVEYRKWKDEMEERAFMAKSNPLALAGALGDDEAGDGDKQQTTDNRETKVARPFTYLIGVGRRSTKGARSKSKSLATPRFTCSWQPPRRIPTIVATSSNLRSPCIHLRWHSSASTRCYRACISSLLSLTTL